MKSIFSYLFNAIKVNANKIVFSNFNGKGYGCNPKYITEELIRRNKGYDIVWLTKEEPSTFPKEVRVVKWGSLKAVYEWSTAKVIVNNVRMGGYFAKGFKKKREQIYIQTWHGSAGIKKMEGDCENLPSKYIKKAKIDSENIDFLLSNCSWLTERYKDSFFYDGDILEYGSPRNDIFFDEIYSRNKIKKKYGISPSSKIVLYMPTFRDKDKSSYPLFDEEKLLKSLEKKFGGDWFFGCRVHPVSNNINKGNERYIDFSNYPDPQELLLIADCLITDYSSCGFDFMLTNRPVFLYVPDKKEYEDGRGLYFSLEETPFFVAKDQNELIRKIEAYDEIEYKNNVKRFCSTQNVVDDGQASKKIVDIIENVIRR